MQRISKIEELADAVEAMHREVQEATTRDRANRIKMHNQKTGVRSSNFVVGDYVLIAVPEQSRRHKLEAKWRGPRRVVRAESDSTYEVENILTFKRVIVHHSRLIHYHDPSLNITVELEAAAEHLDHDTYTVKAFTGLRLNADTAEYEVLTEWKGYSALDATWEPFSSLKIDCPAFLNKFLKRYKDKAMVTDARDVHEFKLPEDREAHLSSLAIMEN